MIGSMGIGMSPGQMGMNWGEISSTDPKIHPLPTTGEPFGCPLKVVEIPADSQGCW